MSSGDGAGSRQLAWWPVHEFLKAILAQANCGPIPLPGSPAWCAMSDGDPRKLLALAMAGEHHVLRVETAQQARAEASKAVAAAVDWPNVATRLQHGRGAAYIPREVA